MWKEYLRYIINGEKKHVFQRTITTLTETVKAEKAKLAAIYLLNVSTELFRLGGTQYFLPITSTFHSQF